MAANSVIGLDIGEKRIGVARAHLIARIPEPLGTLANDQGFTEAFRVLVDEFQPDKLVVGLPRNLDGQETAQSAYVRQFSQEKLVAYNIPLVFQDETLSSRVAEDRLQGKNYKKADIDAQAAVVILEDYLQQS